MNFHSLEISQNVRPKDQKYVATALLGMNEKLEYFSLPQIADVSGFCRGLLN